MGKAGQDGSFIPAALRVPGQAGLQDEKSVEKVDTLCMHVTRGSLEATHSAHVTRERSGSYLPHPRD